MDFNTKPAETNTYLYIGHLDQKFLDVKKT